MVVGPSQQPCGLDPFPPNPNQKKGGFVGLLVGPTQLSWIGLVLARSI